MSSYSEILNAIKRQYPFDRWRKYYTDASEHESCAEVQQAFDELIARLIELGPEAPEAQKKQAFQTAIEATNEHEDLIMTIEREDLCELTNTITEACGLNPDDYGSGEGLASEWREW
ncbi:hypothetical protein IC235_05980 [Hymenobacter sp. BT664]|uniref:Uncharacterized protein n=1 Tax=Hymenobacter montanus TaxID=2771359 RepID=A0A927BB21_9BACT|nr:hypothetical protein [Hymenobacter montanus]MBD2767437.1 hypothetical protein [Hymenobacter montanus]